MNAASAVATGLATVAPTGAVLDVRYPAPTLGSPTHGRAGTARLTESDVLDALGPAAGEVLGVDQIRGVEVVGVQTVVPDLTVGPRDAYDVYLRLHLLSHRLIQPRVASLAGMFGLLTTVVWTSAGPVPAAGFQAVRLRAALGQLTVHSVDKVPRMVDYVVPPDVTIADVDRVRLGAHLAPGTTVMHEGFVNYDAGTLGAAILEGRISAGVIVGPDTHIGGGASIMGTLSGGGREVVSIGRGCLLGANAGTGISLGDRCAVEAGCYVTAGSLITLPDGSVVKAHQLAGVEALLFRRNSTSGALEVLDRYGDGRGADAAPQQG